MLWVASMWQRLEAQEKRAHRATYVGLLNRYLGEQGSKKELARAVGVTPQHLSYLLALDDDPSRDQVEMRLPSPRLAKRIAEALPVGEQEKSQVLRHMLDSRPSLRTAARDPESSQVGIEVLAVAERQLMRVHRSPLPEEVRSSLISAKDLFQVTLSNVSPFSHPLIHTQALVGLSETQALSGAWSDALFSAQHAMTHIEFLDPPAGSEDARLADHLRDQVHLALGYRYLAGGQLSRASQNFEAVKGHCGPPDVGGMRTPSMFWAKLGEARVRMRRARFAIGEVFRDLDEAQSFMTETDEEAALLSGQAAQCRAEAYLMFGSVDRAEAAFRRVFELAREPQVFGVLHLSEFILAFGGLLLKQGQNERLQVVLEDAVDKASRAGLDDTRRQLGRLRDRASKTGGRQLESEKAPPESS